MDQLNRSQFVLLILLVSFVTSVATAIVTATLVNQAPSPITQMVNRVVEKAVPSNQPAKPAEIPSQKQKVVVVTEEDLIVKVVKEASSAVVSVVATKDVPVIEKYFINPFEEDEFFKQFFGSGGLPEFKIPQYRQKGTKKQQVSSGTGFFVSKDGLLLTNNHVVADKDADYTIVMNDGRQLPVKVLARDTVRDVAVLQVSPSVTSTKATSTKQSAANNFHYLTLGDSNKVQVGQTIVAIGNALGEFQNTVSVGIVSGLNRTVIARGENNFSEQLRRVIQTDAAINPGNSGGPMFNLKGEVIGINTAMAKGAENIGFALPINIAKRDLEDIKEFGEIRYPFLGVRYQIVTPTVAKEKKLPVDYGALLVKGANAEPAIMPNSPAAKAGLKEGDIILEFNGTKVSAKTTLVELINDHRVGEKVILSVLREGKTLKIEVTLDEIPKTL